MKKIISSILAIMFISALHSCREINEAQVVDLHDQNYRNASAKTGKGIDTAIVHLPPETVPKVVHDTDPPIKDGGQWRNREKIIRH